MLYTPELLYECKKNNVIHETVNVLLLHVQEYLIHAIV